MTLVLAKLWGEIVVKYADKRARVHAPTLDGFAAKTMYVR